VLPELPAECSAWSSATAALTLDLVSADPEGIVARMHRRDVHDGMVILIAIREPRGGGYEIRCELAERLYSDGLIDDVRLLVRAVNRRKPYRVARRAQLNHMANVTIERSGRVRRGDRFEVKLIDVSLQGIAFLFPRELSDGDLIALATELDGAPVSVQLRVVYVTPASFGRFRVGCEMVHATTQSERAISQLVGLMGSDRGRPQERAA
jgi:hypothetical protein